MAVKVDLPKNTVVGALDAAKASLKRAAGKSGINPLMLELIEKDIAQISRAIDTIAEVK